MHKVATRDDDRERPAGEGVYVVDDDAAVLRGLVRLIRSAGYATTGYASGEDLLAALDLGPPPSCLVVDLSLPGLGGLALQEILAERAPEVPLVFISGRADLASGVRAMK